MEKAGCDARQQLALGQAVLDQAGVNVDRARERNAIDRQLLIMNAIGRKTGEENPDQCDKTGDETQPNHSFTQIKGVGKLIGLPLMTAWTAINRNAVTTNRPAQDSSLSIVTAVGGKRFNTAGKATITRNRLTASENTNGRRRILFRGSLFVSRKLCLFPASLDHSADW